MWQSEAVCARDVLTGADFQDMLDNRVGILQVSRYLGEDVTSHGAREIRARYGDLTRYGGEGYQGGNRRVLKLGASQSEYTYKDPAGYFSSAVKHNERRRSLFPPGADAVDLVFAALANIWPQGVDIARTRNGMPYCLGLARISSGSFLHFDSAVAYDAPKGAGWSPIDQTTSQVAINLILNVPPRGAGGELMVWDLQYEAAADRWRKPQAHHDFLPMVVNGHRAAIAAPETGDLIIFNSRNFHQVAPVTRRGGDPERIALTFFVGPVPEDDGRRLVAWS
ncbi:MAG: 2OG-Fe(II) oxygenase [Streptosporangiaceae bacterium]